MSFAFLTELRQILAKTHNILTHITRTASNKKILDTANSFNESGKFTKAKDKFLVLIPHRQ